MNGRALREGKAHSGGWSESSEFDPQNERRILPIALMGVGWRSGRES